MFPADPEIDRRKGGGRRFLHYFIHTTAGTCMLQKGPGACSSENIEI